MAFRSALVLTCLVVAAGRRHAESPSLLSPEMDVGQVEEKAAEMLESITPEGSDDGHLIPVEASFQVAPSMADISSKTKLTLHLAHVPTPAEPVSVIATFTAKDEESATRFADSLRDYYTFDDPSRGAPVTFNITSPGRQVTVRITPKNPAEEGFFIRAAEGVAQNFGEVNVSVTYDLDMLEFLSHLTNETVLYAELYKGIRYAVSATISKSLEKLLASKVPPAAHAVPGFSASEMMDKLWNLFTGASASVKVVIDDSTREEIFRSLPGMNMTYGTMVAIYRQMVRMYPMALRGSPLAMKSLKFLQDMEKVETLDTVELTGVPGLRAMLVDNTTNGLFQFLGKFSKDIGLIDVLKNTSTLFPQPEPYWAKGMMEAAGDTMPTMAMPMPNETEHP
eukprot:Skav230455  [mRNA]  locus=scaffold186:20498:24661:+ [translate_table: standard]